MNERTPAFFKDIEFSLDSFAPLEQISAPVAPAPDPTDTRYSDFFRDLDGHTQFWSLYHPELNGRYMNEAMSLIRGQAVHAWQNWALKENTPQGPALRTTFITSVNIPATVNSVSDLDSLLHTLLQRHFPLAAGPDGIDVDGYLGAMELFGKDMLPVDADRLARAGGTGGDDVSHHRMDGFNMWFHWAAVFDIARFVTTLGGEKPYRTLLVAAAAFGSAMDSSYRQREHTRPEYTNNPVADELLRGQVRQWLLDAESASSQARELFRLYAQV